MMKMTRTWDSTMSMIPKGGDTIWGGLDWSPEEGCVLSKKRKQRSNDTQISHDSENSNAESKPKAINYGRMISFGRDVAEAHSSEIKRLDFRVIILSFYGMFMVIYLCSSIEK